MSCISSSQLFDVPDGFDYCASPVCLSTGDVVGLSFTAQMGFISALSVVTLLGFVVARRVKFKRDPTGTPGAFVRTNIDGLMLNLLIGDLIMSLGAILDIYWASKSQVSCGPICNAQGAIQLVGETSVALFTLAITVLTFISIIRGRAIKARVWVWGGVAIGVWSFCAIWAGIGGTLENFYAPTPYWCWISREYEAQQIGAEYVWTWISGFGSIFLYISLYLILRGNIKWDPLIGWASLNWSWRREDAVSGSPLLWYPLAYTVSILPLSIVRWVSFNGGDVSPAASFVVASIFNLSGAVNVGLILFARTGVFLSHSKLVDHMNYGSEDTQSPEDDFIQENQTGFGGARVMNQRDSSIVNQNLGSRGGAPDSLEPKSVLGDPLVPSVSMEGANEAGPGRAYLESLGIRRNH